EDWPAEGPPSRSWVRGLGTSASPAPSTLIELRLGPDFVRAKAAYPSPSREKGSAVHPMRRLHDLGQHPGHVLRVHEEHRRPVRPVSSWPEKALAHRLELGPRRGNVGHLERQVMLPTERVALKVRGDR